MSRSVTLSADVAGTPIAAALARPEALIASAGSEIVKDHRRTAVARVPLGGTEVWVKRYKPYAWYRRLEAWLGGSPARRSWRAAARLATRGFTPVRLLAMVETRRLGIPVDAFLVSSAVPGAFPAARSWIEHAGAWSLADRRRLVREAGRALRRLHDAGFYSRDANPDNFLLRMAPGAPPEFWLIDLETFREVGRVSRRRRLKNIVQLHGLLHGRVSAGDRLRLLAAYLGPDRRQLREWSNDAVELDRRKVAEYARRREPGS